PLCAVAAARARVFRIALELADLEGFAVNVGEQPARRFAVEAGGRHQHVAPLPTPWPGSRVELDPVVPSLPGREAGQVDAAGTRVGGVGPGEEGLAPRLGLAPRCLYALVQPAQLLVHASGTDCPACTYACSWARTAARAANADTGPSHGAAPAIRVSTTPAQNQ